jgi:hypothetical protein
MEIVLLSEHVLNSKPIQLSIGLGAGPPDCGPLAPVEHPKLDARLICRFTHQAVKGIDFPDQLALSQSTNRGIAGHHPNLAGIQCNQCGKRATSCGSARRLASGMATANDDDIISVCDWGLWVH